MKQNIDINPGLTIIIPDDRPAYWSGAAVVMRAQVMAEIADEIERVSTRLQDLKRAQAAILAAGRREVEG